MEDINILNENLILFKKMKDLSEKQEKVIDDERLDDFVGILSQREKIKKEITENFRRYSSEIKGVMPKKGNHAGKNISSEISDIIRSIRETDKRIEATISSKKDLLMNDINKIRKGQKALKGYGGGPNKTNRFLNKKG
jgi:hypothetical protein